MKYRREVLMKEIGESLRLICVGISERYEIQFVEIGYECDHVYFLVQSVPSISVSKLRACLNFIKLFSKDFSLVFLFLADPTDLADEKNRNGSA